MQIVKKGTKSELFAQGTCPHCGCVFQFAEKDIKTYTSRSSDWSQNSTYDKGEYVRTRQELRCPDCNELMSYDSGVPYEPTKASGCEPTYHEAKYGTSTRKKNTPPPRSSFAITNKWVGWAVIFSLLLPYVGVGLAIKALTESKRLGNKKLAIAALVISSVISITLIAVWIWVIA